MAGENNFEDFEAIDLSALGQMMESFPELGLVEEPDLDSEETEETDSIETEEQTEETIEENTEEPSSQDIKDSSPLTPYAKMLVEEGLLPNIDLTKFDGTAEALLEVQRQYDLERFENYKEATLDPRVKWLQDNLEQGVPLVRLLELEKQKFEVSNVTEESLASNEDLQKTILRNYYHETTNFSEEKIEKVIERLETLGELGDESKSSLQDLKTIIARKEQNEVAQAQTNRQNAIKQQEETLKEFRTTLDKKDEIINGIKVSQLVKDRIYKTLTTPVAIDESTGMPLNKIAQARAQDPLNFEINLAYIFEITNGFKDWSTLGSSGKKKAIEEFEKSVRDIGLNKNGFKPPTQNKEAKTYLEEMERISRSF